MQCINHQNVIPLLMRLRFVIFSKNSNLNFQKIQIINRALIGNKLFDEGSREVRRTLKLN